LIVGQVCNLSGPCGQVTNLSYDQEKPDVKLLIRRLVLIACGLAVVGVIVWAFLPKPVGAEVAPVTRGTLQVTVGEDGRTRIKERFVVSAPLAGQMHRIELKPGDVVHAGKTLLAAIEPTDPALLDVRAHAEAEARVRSAEARNKHAASRLERVQTAFKYAQSEHEWARKLRGTTAISRQELENIELRERLAAEDLRAAQHEVQVAQFELELAQAALLRTRPGSPGDPNGWRFEIRSPIAGRVLRVFQESAAVVTPSTRLLELGDPNDLECEVDVLSHDAVKIGPGTKVLLEHWGGDKPLHGLVRVVEPAGFLKISALGVEEQRVWVIVDFVDPLEKRRRLGDGYRVEARFIVWEQDNVLKVPAGAVFRRGDDRAVYRVTDGKAELRPVRIGQNNGIEAEVLEGLEEGAQVIVHPSDKIKDGVALAPR
jgi:HlyD family secretion protein